METSAGSAAVSAAVWIALVAPGYALRRTRARYALAVERMRAEGNARQAAYEAEEAERRRHEAPRSRYDIRGRSRLPR
jgi:hypothetical protein